MIVDIPCSVYRYSLQFPRILEDIHLRVCQNSLKCLQLFSGMFRNIPPVFQDSPEFLTAFPKIFGHIPRNL